MDQRLRICFRAEDVARGRQALPQDLVVFNDAVVDEEEAARTIRVGMSVGLGGLAVGGPARVRNAHHTFGTLLPHPLLERRHLADGLRQVRPRTQDGDAARIIAAILKPLQALEKYFPRRPVPNVSDNAAHVNLSDKWQAASDERSQESEALLVTCHCSKGGPVREPERAIRRRRETTQPGSRRSLFRAFAARREPQFRPTAGRLDTSLHARATG